LAFSSDDMNSLLQEAVKRLDIDGQGGDKDGSKKRPVINPSTALVVIGLLSGVLQVDSVLVDREQTVQFVLSGSLKQKTQLEKVMDQIGAMPFDEVMKAFLGRLM